MTFKSLALASALLMASAPALAAPAPTPESQADAPMSPAFLRAMDPMVPRAAASAREVITHHTARIAGQPLPYAALVSELPLPGADGKPVAVAVTYAYVAEGALASPRRPVAFVFNGGPGASSLPLHMQGLGPRQLVTTNGTTHVEDNDASLLNAADLVFIDPVGTGASMPIAGRDASAYWGVSGDAKGVWAIIDHWLAAHGRQGSPVILVGESYGTTRALAMLHERMAAHQPLPNGVVLLSLAIGDAEAPVIEPVTELPTFAAVAWYHKAIDRKGETLAQHYARALTFAQDVYAPALLKGPALTPARQHEVALGMAELIGIPAATLEAHDLRLDKLDFMQGLLMARGDRTGQLDGRITRALAQSNLRPPFDDPSMSLGMGSSANFEAYLKDELGYTVPSPYRSLNLGINFRWTWDKDYGGSMRGLSLAPELTAAMAQKPGLRAFAAGGYYDITTPVYAGQFALEQAQVPAARLTLRRYPTGHSILEDTEGRSLLSTDLHAFVTQVATR